MFGSSGTFGSGNTGNAGSAGGFGSFGQANNNANRQGFGAFGQANAQNSASPFGSNTAAANAGGGFGAAGSAAGGFGSTASSTGFGGQSSTGATFGGSSTGGSLFGGSTSGTQNTGFGQTSAVGGFGGARTTQSTGLFGQQSATTGGFGASAGGGGGFGSSAGSFGGANPGAANTGTAHTPFKEHIEHTTTGAKETFHHISTMDQYKAFSPEELRLQDYIDGRKKATATGAFGSAAGGAFGQNTSAAGGFGSATGAFGSSNTGGAFGQQSSANTGFGASNAGGGAFGQSSTNTFGQSTTGGFGNTGGGFGATSSAGGAFGQTTTNTGFGATTGGFGQPANKPAFGSGSGAFGSTNTGGFGSTGGGFGSAQNKPAFGSKFTFNQSNTGTFGNSGGGFGSSAASGTGGFGAASSGGAFGQSNTNTGGFGNNTAGGFGSTNTAGGFGSSLTSKPAFGSGSGAFGSTAAQNNPTSGGLFGQNTTNTNTTGGFGSANAGTGGLFGSTNTNTGGGLFGTNNNTNTNAFGGGLNNKPATSTTGGGLFGNTATSTNTGGGLFGNTAGNNNAGGGLFGSTGTNTNTGGGLFGNTAGNINTGGGLFGNAGASAATNTNTGGGLFGNTAANTNTGGGLFGSTATNTNTGGGLFGSTTTNTNTGGGLFGASKPAFGATNTGTNTLGGGAGGGGLFGNTGSTGLGFGMQNQQQQQQQQQPQLFGLQQQGIQPQQLIAQIDKQPYGSSPLFDTSKLMGKGSKGSDSMGNSSYLTATPLRAEAMEHAAAEKEAKKRGLNLQLIASPYSNTSTRLRSRGFAVPMITSTAKKNTTGPMGTPMSVSKTPRTIGSSSQSTGQTRRELMGLFGPDGFLSPDSQIPRASVKRLVITRKPSFTVSAASSASKASSAMKSPEISGSKGTTEGSSVFSPLRDRTKSLSGILTSPPSMDNPWVDSSATADNDALSALRSPRRPASVAAPGSVGRTPASARKVKVRISDETQSEVNDDAEDNDADFADDAAAEVSDEEEDAQYWMRPSLTELRAMPARKLRVVKDFTVGRTGVGQVRFLQPVDLTSVGSLSSVPGGIILFDDRVCTVYPDESIKPPRGEGLNVPAVISLEDCWPVDRATREPITYMDDPRVRKHVRRLKKIEETEFIDFVDGTWVFRVEHFSRYGLNDGDSCDDDDDDDDDNGRENSSGGRILKAAGSSFSKSQSGFGKATAASASVSQGPMGGSRAVAQQQPTAMAAPSVSGRSRPASSVSWKRVSFDDGAESSGSAASVFDPVDLDPVTSSDDNEAAGGTTHRSALTRGFSSASSTEAIVSSDENDAADANTDGTTSADAGNNQTAFTFNVASIPGWSSYVAQGSRRAEAYRHASVMRTSLFSTSSLDMDQAKNSSSRGAAGLSFGRSAFALPQSTSSGGMPTSGTIAATTGSHGQRKRASEPQQTQFALYGHSGAPTSTATAAPRSTFGRIQSQSPAVPFSFPKSAIDNKTKNRNPGHAHNNSNNRRKQKKSRRAFDRISRLTGNSSAVTASFDVMNLPPPNKYLRTNETRMAQNLLTSPRPYSVSIAHGRSGLAADAGMMMARSFRVGFGPHGQLIYLRSAPSRNGGGPTSTVVVDNVARYLHANPGSTDHLAAHSSQALDRQRDIHIATVKAQWDHATVSADHSSGCPSVSFIKNTTIGSVTEAIFKHADVIASDHAGSLDEDGRILELASVLFDEIPKDSLGKSISGGDDNSTVDEGAMIDEDGGMTNDQLQHVLQIRRRQQLTRWLMAAVHSSVQRDLAKAGESTSSSAASIFALLTGHKIEAACLAATSHRDYRLSTLIAQVGAGAIGGGGNDPQMQSLIRMQLDRLRETGAEKNFAPEYRRVYELLSGNAEWATDGSYVAEGLDWKRVFSLGLWYSQSPADSIGDAVAKYERAFKAGSYRTRNIGDNSTLVPAAPPLPHWVLASANANLCASAQFVFDNAVSANSMGSSHYAIDNTDATVPSSPLGGHSTLPARSKGGSVQCPADLAARASSLYEHGVWDPVFQLLKLFCDPSYDLGNAIPPESFTCARGDSRMAALLAWLLFVVKQSRGFDDALSTKDSSNNGNNTLTIPTSNSYDRLLAGWAYQLECLGQWQWATFVLMQLSNQTCKAHAICTLLERSLSSSFTTAVSPAEGAELLPKFSAAGQMMDAIDEEKLRFVLEGLRLPKQWIYDAFVTRSRYDRDWVLTHSLAPTSPEKHCPRGIGSTALCSGRNQGAYFGTFGSGEASASIDPAGSKQHLFKKGTALGGNATVAKQYLSLASEVTLREFTWLLSAGNLATAHMLVVQQIAPDAILCGDYSLLLKLLNYLSPAEGSSSPSGHSTTRFQSRVSASEWARGGQVYSSYISLINDIPSILRKLAEDPDNALSQTGEDAASSSDSSSQLMAQVHKINYQMTQLLQTLPSLSARFDPSRKLNADGHFTDTTGLVMPSIGFYDGDQACWFSADEARELRIKHSVAISDMASFVTKCIQEMELIVPDITNNYSSSAAPDEAREPELSVRQLLDTSGSEFSNANAVSQLPLAQDQRLHRIHKFAQSCFDSLIVNET